MTLQIELEANAARQASRAATDDDGIVSRRSPSTMPARSASAERVAPPMLTSRSARRRSGPRRRLEVMLEGGALARHGLEGAGVDDLVGGLPDAGVVVPDVLVGPSAGPPVGAVSQ